MQPTRVGGRMQHRKCSAYPFFSPTTAAEAAIVKSLVCWNHAAEWQYAVMVHPFVWFEAGTLTCCSGRPA